MQALVSRIAPRLEGAPVRVALALPGGARVGAAQPEVVLRLSKWSQLAALAAGRIGDIAAEAVEGRVAIEGPMRALMTAAAHLLPASPAGCAPAWTRWLAGLRSIAAHTRRRDARQVRFHYDLGDEFFALWLDPRRVYSCAYFRSPGMTLAQAQEAKLEHICRKLMLRPGDRLLDIGAGWGGLLLWAAQHHGVRAHGITLSRRQHAWVTRQVRELGLAGRVRIDLMDYRDLDESEGYDRIASVGMFEHVGRARMDLYFRKIARLLRPGGLVMNHGITAGVPGQEQLGAGIGRFIGRYIFPGGELLHVSEALSHLARAGLEMLDTENLRPHYARTLWAWSDALEARLGQARRVLEAQCDPAAAGRVLSAYQLYLAGCALAFERGWTSLHQVLAARPGADAGPGVPAGAQSAYPFNRGYMYPPDEMLYKFKSRITGDLIMLEPNGRHVLQIIGKQPDARGIIQPQEMAPAIQALRRAVEEDEARREAELEQARAEGRELAVDEAISLRRRVLPMIEMLQRCEQEGVEIVWGV